MRIFRKIPNFILTEFIPSIPDLSNMVLNVVAGDMIPVIIVWFVSAIPMKERKWRYVCLKC